jgi:hypothetical protein
MNKVQDITKRGLNNLQEKANYIMSEHISIPSNNDEVYKQYLALLDFFNDYLALSPFLERTISEAKIIQDNEVFRNKIIDREILDLNKILNKYDIKELSQNPTETELLKYHFRNIIDFRIKILNNLNETYSKYEDTRKITM